MQIRYFKDLCERCLNAPEKAKSNRNRNCIFHSLGNRKGRTLDLFFYASHSPHGFSLQTDTYIDELVEIFLKLSMKTVQVHLIIGTTLVIAD